MPKILVTGVAGFLGSTLAKRLMAEGWDVYGIDIVSRQDARRLGYLKLAGYEWRSLMDLHQLTPGIEYVVHCGAQADVPYGRTSPLVTMQTNALGTINLCEAARRADSLQRMVVMSSESVYGATPYIPIPEDAPMNPTSLYGASKAAQELTARSYWHTDKLPVVITRSSTLFGVQMRMTQVVSIFLRQAVLGEPITIHGDGAQSRDFQPVSNLVDGIMLALVNPKAVGDVFNLAGGNEISVQQIATLAVRLTGSKSEIQHLPQREGEQGLRLVPDIFKAKRILGYEPRVSFEEGMRETAMWIGTLYGGKVPTTPH
jgi:nucleoside-diphosphate-sugar epimerase